MREPPCKPQEGGAAEVRLTRLAERDVAEIADYIARGSESAGMRFLRGVRDSAQFLLEHPRAGRARGFLPRIELRSWPVHGFARHLLFYRPVPDGIEVVRVLHGARNLAHLLDDASDARA